jgi:hypothetical protein
MKSIFDTLTDFFLAAHGVFIRLQLKSSSYKKHAVYKFEQIRAWMITEVDPLNSITLFPNALKCAPCVSSFPFFFFSFFYFRDFDSQFTCTNSCHLSGFVIYVLIHTCITVTIVYTFIMWLFCSQGRHWLTNKAKKKKNINMTLFCRYVVQQWYQLDTREDSITQFRRDVIA